MREFRMIVTVKLDDEVRAADVHEYVKDAVGSWGGQYHPDNPFFGIQGRVKVSRPTVNKRAPRP